MHKKFSWLLCLLILTPHGVGLWAEERRAEDRIAEARRALAPVEEGWLEAQKKMRAELDVLSASDAYKEALEAREYQEINRLRREITIPVMDEWREKLATAQVPFDGSEGAIVFAACRMKHQLVEEPGPLFETLVTKYPQSAELKELVEFGTRMANRPLGKDRLRELLALVIEQNPHAAVRAQAHFQRGQTYLRGRNVSEEDRAKGLADYDQVVALLPEDDLLSMRARGPRFAEERLKEGMVAPEIEGVDLFGEPFKLSDYRGKVVMLDFWGDW